MSRAPAGSVRPTAVAGTFYPADPRELGVVVDRALAAVTPAPGRPSPKALVVPHAGYVYSGPIAASGYAQVLARRGTIQRVVLLGPAHRVPVDGMAVPTTTAFATPLGPVAVDDDLRRIALALPGVHRDDRPHAPEHSLEVQLPFLVRTLGPDITVLPVVVGQAPAHQVADLLEAVWGGPETLVVISSDLSHYHDHTTATELDRRTAEAIVARRGEAIGSRDACGAHPLRGLLEVAERRGLDIELLDLRNSGDTAGDRSRVVGYGAFAATEPAA
jgi:AmmeMemoRadiSam system protein B